MEDVICPACGEHHARPPIDPPKNGRDAKVVRYICSSCGSAVLRDGSARRLYGKKQGGESEKTINPQETTGKTERKTDTITAGNDDANDGSNYPFFI